MQRKKQAFFRMWMVATSLLLCAFDPPPLIILPDLRTLPPRDLRLIVIAQNPPRRVLLRFSNSIWNAGQASLDLTGEPDRAGRRITVRQVIQGANGPREDRNVGEFIFHPEHNHWHLDGFSLYEVWSLTEHGGLDQRQASSGKVSYCLRDDSYLSNSLTSLARAPQRYFNCGIRQQGISPGWVDTYKSKLADQWVDITGLQDGPYALVSTVNPSGILAETDLTNNAGVTYFMLSKQRILSYGDSIRDVILLPERPIPHERRSAWLE